MFVDKYLKTYFYKSVNKSDSSNPIGSSLSPNNSLNLNIQLSCQQLLITLFTYIEVLTLFIMTNALRKFKILQTLGILFDSGRLLEHSRL